jgi:hypothetical protein
LAVAGKVSDMANGFANQRHNPAKASIGRPTPAQLQAFPPRSIERSGGRRAWLPGNL